MFVRICAAVGVALVSLSLAASADASVSFVPFGTALPPGETTITNFATLGGVTGTAGLFTGSESVSAAPAFGPGVFDAASYLSVQGGESATLSLAAVREISVYAGSLDSYNTITFGGPGGGSYTGGLLSALTTAIDDGNQAAGSSNGRFIFDLSAPVTSVTFSSGGDAFEVASVAGGVPEPASWALMLIGVGGLGAIRRRWRQAASPA
jgi:hypothetical protein